MPRKIVYLLLGLALPFNWLIAQNASLPAPAALPVFTRSFTAAGKQYSVVLAGRDPAIGGTTTISTVLVPVSLAFDGYRSSTGEELVLDATADVFKVAQSPIFQKFAFATGTTQYGDAVQRAEFFEELSAKPAGDSWHTLLGQPRIAPAIRIQIPVADGYLLTSKRTGHSLAVVDLEFIQKELFQRLTQTNLRPDELVIAVTKNTMFYPLNDATVCCSWGAHGVHIDMSDPTTNRAQPFILGTYLDSGVVPRYADIQTLAEQMAEWMNDPLQGKNPNRFPAWENPSHSSCGGRGEGSAYRFAEPTDIASMSNATQVTMHGTVYHLANVALLPWFMEKRDPGTFRNAYSFPDTRALTIAAVPCSSRRGVHSAPTTSPLAQTNPPNGHQLIGYWDGYSSAKMLPLRDVSPQWDVVIVAFAPPAKGSASRMFFVPPIGETPEQFKSDIAYLQGKGKKVLISLGGGGEVVVLNTSDDLRNFVSSVSAIVQQYGFDGVDLDLETPSLILQPGDTDFRHPTTPSVLNLIAAMRQLRRRFGPKFMIAEVPEGPQVPAGMETYGGQFGSFLPVIYGTRDILSFVDVQNYNTPPLLGLDGNYYMPETSDYYVAMAEMMVRGFPVARNPKQFFPPLPPEKVAIGFMAGPPQLPTIENALRYVIQGKPFANGEYKLQKTGGYPDFNGAMFWNIESDWWDNYQMSSAVGSLLHNLPPPSSARK
jgi:chitinase